ncbi:MAG: UPF0280 family protein [Candidatus Bathyarchaeia archaeon]
MSPFFKMHCRLKESNILLKSDNREALYSGLDAFRKHRIELETYLALHPQFAQATIPIEVENNVPRIVAMMADAAVRTGVGPMAAVAGALADLAVEAMRKAGAQTAIVENGGEISAMGDEAFVVALHAGKSTLGSGLGFKILPSDCPIGIATSSATFSHASSFGEADTATVFADTAALADAAATAICNAVVGENIERSIAEGLSIARRMKGIRGVLVTRQDYVGSVGWVPQLVYIEE